MAIISSTMHDPNDTRVLGISRRFAWLVFALTFGLLISDYMSRQVLNAVFPLLKTDWQLSDAELGSLSGIVALMVGLLTFPLSLLADRWGRVRSLILMAVLWSLATLACAMAQNYQHMFWARLFVGVGEAAYGSVGLAVVLSVFPKSLRATLTGAFMAGGMFGSVLGMASGGWLASLYGWRMAFAGMAVFGLMLALVYWLLIKANRIPGGLPQSISADDGSKTTALKSLFASRSIVCTYIGSGLQLFVGGAVIVWLPSYFNRYYQLPTDKAGALSAIIVLCAGTGMILCGILTDKLAKSSALKKIHLAIAYCLSSMLLLSVAFALPTGIFQLVLIAAGMLLAAGTTGPAGAMVANLTPVAIHGTAFATLTLANNLLGLAPAPFITGALADAFGLDKAMQVVPLISVLSATMFYLAGKSYLRDLQHQQHCEGSSVCS